MKCKHEWKITPGFNTASFYKDCSKCGIKWENYKKGEDFAEFSGSFIEEVADNLRSLIDNYKNTKNQYPCVPDENIIEVITLSPRTQKTYKDITIWNDSLCKSVLVTFYNRHDKLLKTGCSATPPFNKTTIQNNIKFRYNSVIYYTWCVDNGITRIQILVGN